MSVEAYLSIRGTENESYYWSCRNCGQASLSVRFNSHCVDCLNVRDKFCSVDKVLLLPLEKQISPINWHGGLLVQNQCQVPYGYQSLPEDQCEDLSDARFESPCYSVPGSDIDSTAVSPSNIHHGSESWVPFSEIVNQHDQYDQQTLQVLESSLAKILKDHHGLAAALISKIKYLMFSLARNGSYTFTPTSEDTKTPANYLGNSNTPPRKDSRDAKISSDSTLRKRPRKPNDEDERPRKQTPRKFKELANTSPSYACHWNKLDPLTYCADNKHSKRYRNCVDAVITDFRRIKDHLEAAHACFACEHCGKSFRESKDRIAHHVARDCGGDGVGSPVEGINFAQWAAICEIIGQKGKGKGKDGIWKWNAIWRILFPDKPLPRHPWKENHNAMRSSPAAIPAIDVEGYIAKYEKCVSLLQENGVLEENDSTLQIFTQLFKHVIGNEDAEGLLLSLQQDNTLSLQLERNQRRQQRFEDVDPTTPSQDATPNLQDVHKNTVPLSFSSVQPSPLPDFGYDPPRHNQYSPSEFQFTSPYSATSQGTPVSFTSSYLQSASSSPSVSRLSTNHSPYSRPPQMLESFPNPAKVAKNDPYLQSFQPDTMEEYNLATYNENPYMFFNSDNPLPTDWMASTYFTEIDYNFNLQGSNEIDLELDIENADWGNAH